MDRLADMMVGLRLHLGEILLQLDSLQKLENKEYPYLDERAHHNHHQSPYQNPYQSP
jgi:hypothetical protein